MNSYPLVSIIITTKNSASTLPALLQSCCDQSYKPIEVIVVDNNSTDATQEIVKQYSAKFFTKGPERSAQRNYGAKKATGEFLLILDSDMILTEQVIESAVSAMIEQPDCLALVIPEESFGQGFWAKCKCLERSFYVGVSWMEAARFFRNQVFYELGGYDVNNTGTEDYDLPQRIEGKYGYSSIGRINKFIYHDENRMKLLQTCKKKFYYAQDLHAYKQKTANRNKLAQQSNLLLRYKLFLAQPSRLLRNPLIGGGMLVMKTCEMFFGGCGYILGKFKNS